jgi:hypothetical protein
MAQLIYNSSVHEGISSTGSTNTTELYHWFDLNKASDWLRSNGLGANDTITSAYVTTYVKTSAKNSFQFQASLYDANKSNPSGLKIETSLDTNGDSNYHSKQSKDLVGDMNSSNVGYFSRPWLRIYTYYYTWTKQTWDIYYTLTVNFTPHSHSYTSTVTKQPTCETAGETTYTCSCGDSYVDKTKPMALGHSWDTEYTWTEDTKTGYWYCMAVIDCNRSGCTAHDAVIANVTRTVKIPATCTEMGTTSHTATFDVDWATTQVKDVQDIPAKGHTWVNATCTAPKKCSVCGATEGSALGHSYTSAITKQPTCTEKGVKTFTCQRDSSHKYTEEVAPLGHDYVKTEVAPTTTTDGYDNYVCSRCGDSYQNNYTCLYTVKCDSEGGTVSGGGTHSKGTNVTISATPNEGWYVAGWKLNGIELTHLAGVNSFNETVDKSKEYEVVFAKIPPKFTSVQMLYQNQQISETNKVLANQFFRIVVGVE